MGMELTYNSSNQLSSQSYLNEPVLISVTTDPDVQMKGYLALKYGLHLSHDYLQILVLNALGQKVYTRELQQPQPRERIAVSLGGWTAGVYYVSVENGAASVVRKLVVR